MKDSGLISTVAQKPADMAIIGVKIVDKALESESVEEKVNIDLADAADVDGWLAYAAKYSGK